MFAPSSNPTARHGRPLHCTCCGRPFARPSSRGPAPRYCSADCRAQMRVRLRVWSGRIGGPEKITPDTSLSV